MNDTPIEIGVFHFALPIGAQRSRYQPVRRLNPDAERRLCIAAFSSLLANFTLVGVLVAGTSVPGDAKLTGHVVADPGEIVARIITIDRDSDAPVPEDAVSLRALDIAIPVHVGNLPRPRLDIAVNVAARENADPVTPTVLKDDEINETERLRGIYAQQIGARVQRALEEHGLSGAKHSCSVALTQAAGAQSSIRVTRCGSDPAWQEALVSALREAQPLPLPPREDLYSPKLVIEVSDVVAVELPPLLVPQHGSGCDGHCGL